ncbi:MAG: cytidine deaminase, partial [Vibrio sp.]
SAHICAQQFADLVKKSGLEPKALKLALLPVAASFGHTPLSKFHVGAVVEGQSGNIYLGANMEFTGVQLGQTIHAEQSAISHAWMHGETGITDITINYTPCGHCRQFMNELVTAKALKIQLPDRDAMSLDVLLPESFGPSDLNIKERLMDQHRLNCSLDGVSADISMAIEALNQSHAPYTNNYAGVTLRTRDGWIAQGSYAENAAYNPSLPPLQVALNMVRLSGYEFNEITHAALAEAAKAPISHLAETQATLEMINPDIPLEYVSLSKAHQAEDAVTLD